MYMLNSKLSAYVVDMMSACGPSDPGQFRICLETSIQNY